MSLRRANLWKKGDRGLNVELEGSSFFLRSLTSATLNSNSNKFDLLEKGNWSQIDFISVIAQITINPSLVLWMVFESYFSKMLQTLLSDIGAKISFLECK